VHNTLIGNDYNEYKLSKSFLNDIYIADIVIDSKGEVTGKIIEIEYFIFKQTNRID